jgi:hypothetical protein
LTEDPVQMETAMLKVWALVLLVLGVSPPAKAADTEKQGGQTSIYVSANGKDSARGTVPAEPVGSLRQALDIYQKGCRGKYRILIDAGEYSGEELVLRRPACPLRIEAASKGARPRFVGKGDGTWLRIAAPGAKMIDLEITGLEIARYQTAISLNGNRDDSEQWVGGVSIVDNRFVRIGAFEEVNTPSTAAIRLVNARSNRIEGNRFEGIRNLKACGGLHSLYLAHMSSDNRIEGNHFVDGCGDTIKVRDSSDRNIVRRNTFERQEGNALMLDSFCDKQVRGDCSKAAGECPSWDNVFDENTVVGPRSPTNKKITAFRRIESDLSAVCPSPPKRKVRIQEGRYMNR